MLSRLTYIAIALLLLASCGSQKDSALREESPTWIQSKPQDNFAYIGIGVARVLPDGSHLQTAKSAALSDLSSEISVEISSSSLLQQMEMNRRFREEFRAQTEITSSEYVEGFELVDDFEKDGYYWVMYQLDKSTYARIRAERKTQAVSRAMSFYRMALEANAESQIQSALTHAFSALKEIKPYLNEAVSSPDIQGDLAITLYSFIDSVLSSVQVIAIKREQDILRFNENDAKVYFQTQTSSGRVLSNIPVYLYYSGGFLRNSQVVSDQGGKITFSLPPAGNEGNYEQLEADINFVALASSATNDPLLRLMITRHPSTKVTVGINVISPKVFLESSEFQGEEELMNKPISSAIRKFLLDNRFEMVQDRTAADVVINIKAQSRPLGVQNNMHRSSLSGEILVMDSEGRLLSSHPLDGYQGVQLSEEGANREAYRSAIRELEDHEFRKLFLE